MSQANKEVSNALFQAYISKEPIEFVSKTYNLTEPEAYKTQDDLIHQIQAEKNVPVKGYKVSMTSAATQAIANTNEPNSSGIKKYLMICSGEAPIAFAASIIPSSTSNNEFSTSLAM